MSNIFQTENQATSQQYAILIPEKTTRAHNIYRFLETYSHFFYFYDTFANFDRKEDNVY